MLALQSDPDSKAIYRRLLEAQCEVEVGALVGAKDGETAQVQLGRVQVILLLLDLPQRVATLNQEHYARLDAKQPNPDDPASFHPGSPYFWDSDGARRESASHLTGG